MFAALTYRLQTHAVLLSFIRTLRILMRTRAGLQLEKRVSPLRRMAVAQRPTSTRFDSELALWRSHWLHEPAACEPRRRCRSWRTSSVASRPFRSACLGWHPLSEANQRTERFCSCTPERAASSENRSP